MNLTFKKKILIVVLFLALGYHFLITSTLDELEKKNVRLEQTMDDFYHQGTLMQEQGEKENIYEEKIKDLSKREIVSLDYNKSRHRNKLFMDLNDFSDNYDVELEYINPEGEEEKGDFLKQKFSFYLTGQHEEVFQFVSSITDLDYIVRIENFRLRLEEENKLELEVNLANYLSK